MNKVLSDDRKTQSNRESMCPLWFFHLYILSSATTALSTLYQGRLYLHIYIYIYIYHICVHCILPLLTKAVWSWHVRQCVLASKDDSDTSERVRSLKWSTALMSQTARIKKTGLRNLFAELCSFPPFQYACK